MERQAETIFVADKRLVNMARIIALCFMFLGVSNVNVAFGATITNVTCTASSSNNSNPANRVIDGSGLNGFGEHSNSPFDLWLSVAPDMNPWIQFEFDTIFSLDEMHVWNCNHSSEAVIGWGVKNVRIQTSVNGVNWTLLTTTQFDRAPGFVPSPYNTAVDFGGVAAKYVRLNIQSNWGGLLPQYGLSEVRFIGDVGVSATLSVSSSAGGSVAAPGEGSYSFTQGTSVSIVASPQAHYQFVDWTGTAVNAGKVANARSASTTVTMDRDYTLAANFALDQCTLTTSSSSGGSVSTPGEGTFSYDYGTSVSVVATPQANYSFVRWAGTAVDENHVADVHAPETTVTMEGSYSLQPLFVMTNAFLYVDANATTGSLQDGTLDHPFAGIQQAIDAAQDGEIVVVLPGLYVESLNFKGKAIYVTSLASEVLVPGEKSYSLGAIDKTVIHGNNTSSVVVFESGEDANTVLNGFTLTGGRANAGAAIQCYGSGPTISHCLIAGNRGTQSGGAIACFDSQVLFLNCTIADNVASSGGAAVTCLDSPVVFLNCILWGNQTNSIHVISGHEPLVQYSTVQGTWFGVGNLGEDPCFVAPGFWVNKMDASIPLDAGQEDAVFVLGDYHLQSESGRYHLTQDTWHLDTATSPCIDTGDPAIGFDRESIPNGRRINMGAYGGTVEASRSTLADEIEFLSISEPDFTGEMSRCEITNTQYCVYLNDALAEGLIRVENDRVYAADYALRSEVYCLTYSESQSSQIMYLKGTFQVRERDGRDMGNHPVVCVGWHGATAFCEYYGYRLPTEDEWQAVADYDGTYIYGCGDSIDFSIANYGKANPLGLSSLPLTSPVGYYDGFGYGLCDLAGNVTEWTSSASDHSYIARGGSWANFGSYCTVDATFTYSPDSANAYIGFRVCR